MGAKHPESLGQPASHIWADIWPTIGPMLTGVLRTGQVTFSEEQLLIVQPAGCRKRRAVETGGGGQTASAAIWLDRGARGPLTLEDRVLLGVLSAHLGNALARAIHYQQARDLAVALQHSVIGRAGAGPGPRPGHDAGAHDRRGDRADCVRDHGADGPRRALTPATGRRSTRSGDLTAGRGGQR
jgi:hypothetical protein